MIHEQVQKQLDYLKSWVDGEENRKKNCENWKIPYIPSVRKWENKRQYTEYLEEIKANGDKNLLVLVRMRGNDRTTMYGIYPFARRYADDLDLLVHRTKHGTEVLLKKSECEIVK